jgi:hypothetical protein
MWSSARSVRLRLLLAVGTAAWIAAGATPANQGPARTSFAAEIAALSEPDGYFDTDNLISNERSYLHVMDALTEAGAGGVYIGVGPDQNFSYIARIRPARAYIVDIRRDNLLLHLLFKALFRLAEHRAAYLGLLFGRAVSGDAASWREAPLSRVVAAVDRAADDEKAIVRLRARVDRAIAGSGVPLSSGDRATLDRFHRTFIQEGLALRFRSAGRPARRYYPTYRELLLETDRAGRVRSFLASDDTYAFVRDLQGRDRVVPVVGNLGGTHALAAIARRMRARGESLAAFYTSNVEFYLSRNGAYDQFVSNLDALPHDDRSVIIRSIFPGSGQLAPADAVPGYYSASVVQPVTQLTSTRALAPALRR